jgi:hypothetical protein
MRISSSQLGDKTEVDRAPALRISHIVHGRINEGTRVKYLVDPTGTGSRRAIPEKVVLHRWRRRRMEGVVFDGYRLSPTIWRAIKIAFPMPASRLCGLSVDQLSPFVDAAADRLRESTSKLPSLEHLAFLLAALGQNNLKTLLERHNDPERKGFYGTPDPFLHAKNANDGGLTFFRFIEVKKPRQHISADQHEEIAFLRSLRLPARVLRLIERA